MTNTAVIFQQQPLNPVVAGADPTNARDSLAALVATFAASAVMFVSPGAYALSGNWTPPTQDAVIQMAANVSFTGAHVDFNNLIPYESSPGPLFSLHLIRKDYGAGWAGTGNVFQFASYAKASVATVPVVAGYFQGEAAVAGSHAWGINPAAIVSNATGVGIAAEIDIVLTANGLGYGVAVASSGTFQPQNAFQVDANQSTCRFIDGTYIHFSETSSRGCLTGAAHKIAGGGGAASVCQNFLQATGVKASVLEIDLPSFAVGATSTVPVNRLIAIGTNTGGLAELRSDGDANAGLGIRAKPGGTGHVFITDPSLNAVIDVGPGSTLGFFNHGGTTKPTVTGSRATDAWRTSLMTALSGFGLVNDTTTA